MAVSVPAVARAQNGAGISGQSFENGVSANYVREHSGPTNSVRLIAVVLWRGATEWTMIPGPSAAIARARLDSVRMTSERRGVLAGGTVTATANAWVEYEAGSRTIAVLNRAYPAGQGDSTAVIMVDRVDHVGGDPIVSTANVVCGSNPGPDLHAGFTAAARQSTIDMMQHWRDCLNADPAVAAFLNRGAPR